MKDTIQILPDMQSQKLSPRYCFSKSVWSLCTMKMSENTKKKNLWDPWSKNSNTRKEQRGFLLAKVVLVVMRSQRKISSATRTSVKPSRRWIPREGHLKGGHGTQGAPLWVCFVTIVKGVLNVLGKFGKNKWWVHGKVHLKRRQFLGPHKNKILFKKRNSSMIHHRKWLLRIAVKNICIVMKIK